MADTNGTAVQDMLQHNVSLMNRLEGFDVVVVCTGNAKQANYWQKRLEAARGSVVGTDAVVLAVHEDWPGGAGNALGTLYAYQNAAALAQSSHGLDLGAKLAAGEVSCGLYHTAGKGTRMAPLPGSENNNKPGVKLPVTVDMGGKKQPLTILEAVIKQTGVYAKSRKGRLSVFWGDQVFIPSVPAEYTPTHHADILCTLGQMVSEEEWAARGMDKYGLIAVNDKGDAAQVEKVSHATATRLLSSLGTIKSVGPSLGSFSVSQPLLAALMGEFSGELQARQGKLDSDPHLWMPFTLEEAAYVELMGQKEVGEEEARAHYARMKKMLGTFWESQSGASKPLGLFGAVDVGSASYWWDYGQLKLYTKYNMLLTEDGAEADMLRAFLGVHPRVKDSQVGGADVDQASVVSTSQLSSGSVRRSVLSNVRCGIIETEGAILVNVVARKIVAPRGAVVYNIMDSSPEGVCLKEGGVLVGVHGEDGSQTPIRSAQSIDGGKVWKQVVEGNSSTFEQIYDSNQDVDVFAVETARAQAETKLWTELQSSC